jgi:hypothetical protein
LVVNGLIATTIFNSLESPIGSTMSFSLGIVGANKTLGSQNRSPPIDLASKLLPSYILNASTKDFLVYFMTDSCLIIPADIIILLNHVIIPADILEMTEMLCRRSS